MSAGPQLQEAALAHKLPYWWIGDGVLVHHDGSMAIGLRLTGVDGQALVDDKLNQTAHVLRTLLNELPTGFRLQFLRGAQTAPDADYERYLGELRSANPILREQRQRTADHLRRRKLRRYETYLFVIQPAALGAIAESLSYGWLDRLTGKRDPLSVTRQHHLAAVEALRQRGEGLRRTLQHAEITAHAMSDEQLISVIHRFLNPGTTVPPPELVDGPSAELTPEQRKLYRSHSLREQLVGSGLSWNADTLFLGDPLRPHRAMGLKTLPRATRVSLIQAAGKLEFPHWLSVTVTALDTNRKFEEFERGRNRAAVKADGFVRDVAASNRAAELEDAMGKMDREGQQVFAMALHVLFGADSMPELDERTTEAAQLFRKQGCGVVTEQQTQLFAFLGMLPGNGHRQPHERTAMTNNVADFLPVYDSWLGDRRPLFLAQTRQAEPFFLDITDPKRTNWNWLVFGSSGSGKSFLVLALAASSMLGQGGPLIVIDIGGKELGSYYRLVTMMGGDFVDLSLDGANCINPFYARADLFADERGQPRAEPDELKLGFLVSIASLLVTDPGAGPMSRVAEGVLTRAILATYDHVGDARPPIFTDLADVLAQLPGDEEEKGFALKFSKALRAILAGPYAKLINQQSKVSIKSDFVVFDLKGLESVGDIATVVLLIISSYVWNMVSRPRDSFAWLVYDECWKFLQNPVASKVQAELYRTARKFKGGFGVMSITQKLEDFTANPQSKAIISNSAQTILLRHKDGHEAVAGLLGDVNERELALFKSLRGEKGAYSEFLLRQESGTAICRYAPSSFEYWLNTTDPLDRKLEAQLLAENAGDRLATLRQLAKRYPNGAAAGAKESPRA